MKGPLEIAQELSRQLSRLSFAFPVAYVYDPLQYAWQSHRAYVERFGLGRKEALLVGMNPGPWGMAQTGVPFGEIRAVRDWMGLRAPIGRPRREHPKKPVSGIACGRSEVSGARLWGWVESAFGAPEAFFERFFVVNYCPLMFLDEGGRNVTPDKLPGGERGALERLCDAALRELAVYYRPARVIGIGAFAENRARRALEGFPAAIGTVLHPSPASPLANRGWAEAASRTLKAQGVFPSGTG